MQKVALLWYMLSWVYPPVSPCKLSMGQGWQGFVAALAIYPSESLQPSEKNASKSEDTLTLVGFGAIWSMLDPKMIPAANP